MNSLTNKLVEAVNQTSTANQSALLDFITSMSAEFEEAQDEKAVSAILGAAMSKVSITEQEKKFLSDAVQEFLGKDPARTNEMLGACPT